MGEVVKLPVRRDEPQEAPARPAERTTPTPTRGVGPLWRESGARQRPEERSAAGKRLVDVAEEAGVSPQYLSEVERGLKDPSSQVLAATAGPLGLSVADLATRVASPGSRPATTFQPSTSARPSSPGSPQSPVCLAA